MFTIEVHTEQAERKFELSAESMTDLNEPLTRFGKYLKSRALDRYKAQNFAPLAPSTVERRAQKGLRSLEGKLKGDVRKAMKRARLARGESRPGLAERIFGSSSVRHAMEDAISGQTRGVKNRQAVLEAFQHYHRKGFKERVGGRSLSIKQEISLAQREARAVARAIGQPVLGGLPRTLVILVGNGTVALVSRTHQTWSDAHNKGETVGHGAKLPQRATVVLEDHDVDVLVSILKDAALLPFQEGLHGPGY